MRHAENAECSARAAVCVTVCRYLRVCTNVCTDMCPLMHVLTLTQTLALTRVPLLCARMYTSACANSAPCLVLTCLPSFVSSPFAAAREQGEGVPLGQQTASSSSHTPLLSLFSSSPSSPSFPLPLWRPESEVRLKEFRWANHLQSADQNRHSGSYCLFLLLVFFFLHLFPP